MLKFEGVKKHYEDFELDLTLEVPEGYVTGLIGANGAGKSTAFKAALGLIRPDAGVVKMLGKNVEDFTVQDKEWIGVVLADSGFSGYLRVKDILPMLESMYHKFQNEDFLEMCKKYQLPLDKKIKEFSTGMKRKLQIAAAVSHGADVLLLDEPTAGMDALSRRQMWNLLRKLNGKNLTILLTTHYMEEAQNLCSRVALMDHGKLEEVNTPAGLIDSLGNYTVDEFAGDETHSHYFHSREEAIAYLSGLSGQASLRETTLEDVFVERAGRHLMPS